VRAGGGAVVVVVDDVVVVDVVELAVVVVVEVVVDVVDVDVVVVGAEVVVVGAVVVGAGSVPRAGGGGGGADAGAGRQDAAANPTARAPTTYRHARRRPTDPPRHRSGPRSATTSTPGGVDPCSISRFGVSDKPQAHGQIHPDARAVVADPRGPEEFAQSDPTRRR
jgi:hypothetical protein